MYKYFFDLANFDEIDLKFRSTKYKSSFSSQFGCRFNFHLNLTEEYINFVQKVFSLQSRNVWRLYQPTRSSYFTTAMKNSHCQENVWCILNRPQAKISWQPNAAQTADCSVCVKKLLFPLHSSTFFALATTQLCRLPVPALFWRVFQRSKNLSNVCTFYDPKSKCSWLDNTCGKEV